MLIYVLINDLLTEISLKVLNIERSVIEFKVKLFLSLETVYEEKQEYRPEQSL